MKMLVLLVREDTSTHTFVGLMFVLGSREQIYSYGHRFFLQFKVCLGASLVLNCVNPVTFFFLCFFFIFYIFYFFIITNTGSCTKYLLLRPHLLNHSILYYISYMKVKLG